MKTSGSASAFTVAILFALFFFTACSGGGITEPVSPRINPTSTTQGGENYSDDANSNTGIEPGASESQALEIAIDVSPCNPDGASRSYALLVYNLNSFNRDQFSYDRFSVRWYSFDGTTLSESNILECVAGGTYFVDVVDDVARSAGRATITL